MPKSNLAPSCCCRPPVDWAVIFAMWLSPKLWRRTRPLLLCCLCFWHISIYVFRGPERSCDHLLLHHFFFLFVNCSYSSGFILSYLHHQWHKKIISVSNVPAITGFWFDAPQHWLRKQNLQWPHMFPKALPFWVEPQLWPLHVGLCLRNERLPWEFKVSKSISLVFPQIFCSSQDQVIICFV